MPSRVSNFKLEEDQRRSHQVYVQEELSSTFPHVLKDTNSCSESFNFLVIILLFLFVIDFNDVPTNSLPFGSNKSPPLLLSAQSTSTLVPVAISPGQLHSTNPFLFNTHPQLSITSKDFMSNQRVSANSTSTSPQVQSNCEFDVHGYCFHIYLSKGLLCRGKTDYLSSVGFRMIRSY